ncbi:MAG: 4Fe-4S dicluster domain-containing protein [Paludibacter sp.]|nr:4Fe-4S dicluster domain-containing protein [Paludibacter sp.]
MAKLYDLLLTDVRFREGLTACMNCGICTAICPAAEFYTYDPRQICNTVQTRDEEKIEALLKSDTIWYCGQCMSCKTRCPRGNAPALVISVLRKQSQELGYFTESEKGRQQYAIKRTVGENITGIGYCVTVEKIVPDMHPEQGPVWKWYYENAEEVVDRLGGNYRKEGPGALRIIPQVSMDEIQRIFEVTGGKKLQDSIEDFSEDKATEMDIKFNDTIEGNDYFNHLYTTNSGNHQK